MGDMSLNSLGIQRIENSNEQQHRGSVVVFVQQNEEVYPELITGSINLSSLEGTSSFGGFCIG